MPLNLFARLMPREEAFVELFCEQSKLVIAAAQGLRGILVDGGGPATLSAHSTALTRLEAEADAVAKRIFVAANRTFNAPLDREDILGLAHDLDDVVDLIEETAKRIARYQIREFSAEMKEMADAVVRSADMIQEAVPLLGSITRDHERILALCERIGRTEGEADGRFDAGLTRLREQLCAGEIPVIAYLDHKEIYEHLEAVVDTCDDVANAIETITAKHV